MSVSHKKNENFDLVADIEREYPSMADRRAYRQVRLGEGSYRGTDKIPGDTYHLRLHRLEAGPRVLVELPDGRQVHYRDLGPELQKALHKHLLRFGEQLGSGITRA